MWVVYKKHICNKITTKVEKKRMCRIIKANVNKISKKD